MVNYAYKQVGINNYNKRQAEGSQAGGKEPRQPDNKKRRVHFDDDANEAADELADIQIIS